MKKTILAIGAHPDDIEIGCGGALGILQEQGYTSVHLIVTSGEEGSQTFSKNETRQIREREARDAARILNASQVLFFREPDGLTAYTKETKLRLIAILRELRPEIVFTHACADLFPDHQVVHQLTMSAVFAAQGPWYPEGGVSAHRVPAVYGYEVWNPLPNYQLAVDISASMERKVTALRAHASQVRGVDYIGAIQGLAKYRGAMTMTGSYAEVFEVLRTSRL